MVSSATWGSVGDPTSVFEPCWNSTQPGDRVSVLVQISVWGNKLGIGEVIPSNRKIRLYGVLPDDIDMYRKVTVLDAMCKQADPFIDLVCDEHSVVRMHWIPDESHMHNLVECCAGMGGSSWGFIHNGFNLRCAVEWKCRLAELHRQMHPTIPVVEEDASSNQALKEVWKHCDEPFVTMGGVACQPYSRGGHQGGGDDDRSSSLTGTLRFSFLSQCPAVVLECVEPAATNSFVRHHLSLFQALGFHVTECILKLEDVWSSNRTRWWAVATISDFGAVHLSQPPTNAGIMVRDVMPYIKEWPPAVTAQLALDADEVECFTAQVPMRKYSVRLDQKMPTALHSWGGQAVACACGCRDALSKSLLLSRGVFAQVVPIAGTHGPDGPKYRHLHAAEVALLNGMHPNKAWSNNERLNLCAAGQMASPLQSVWISGLLKHHVDQVLGVELVLDPVHRFNLYKQILWEQAFQMYPNLANSKPEHDIDMSHVGDSGFGWVEVTWMGSNPIVHKVASGATLGHLIAAELAIQFQVCGQGGSNGSIGVG